MVEDGVCSRGVSSLPDADPQRIPPALSCPHDGATGYDARVRDPPDVLREIDQLVNGWCDRRCLAALRCILRGWPLSSPLTDAWGDLLDALEKVRAFAKDALTEDERARVEDAIHDVGRIVYRQ
jgi:hypothetical protein